MDESGVIAEMLKDGSKSLLAAIRDLFNDVLSFTQQPPDEWRKTKLIVIFKKGDPNCPGNYRPIAILPILYKLFSRILCRRLQVYLLPQQSVDQAAYRKGFSAENHLFTVAQLIERSHEFNFNLWLGLVDTVEHTQLWKTLLAQGVPRHYVVLLRSLYADQVATVQSGASSRSFKIGRGVKQSDPVSALLFIAVMQACFGELQAKWMKLNGRRKRHGFGVSLCANTRNLTDLRFADDVILVAQSKADGAKMLHHLRICSAKFGLKINFAKTKILTWNFESNGCRSISLDGNPVAVLDQCDSEKYLGRKLAFENCGEVEIANRLAAGWAAFHKHKNELCSKFYRLRDRVRLFEAIVTPTVLYGCSTWALTQRLEGKIQVARRKMLRYVFRLHRRTSVDVDEDWAEYMQRSARSIERLSEELEIVDWIETHRRRKWRFARRLATVEDGRWSKLVLNWLPSNGFGRGRGRPCTRWVDQIVSLAGGDWMSLARDDPATWEAAEDVFVTF